MHKIWVVIFFFVVLDGFGQAQDSLRTQYLDAVTVTATRIQSDQHNTPQAISIISPESIASSQQLSLKNHLLTVPGLYSQNAYNYAQDLRISIRGFGSRAAFGINGVKLIVDGIPETTPDGQGQLDNLNLALIERIEVIKGASSALYGNASGGVIQVNTIDSFDKNFLESTISRGSYGYGSYAVTGGISTEKTSYLGHFRYFHFDGYRDHNQLRQSNASFKAKHSLSENLNITFLAEYLNSPEAQDPGGLTLAETEADFNAPREANVTYDAGEAVTQFKTGASLEYAVNSNLDLNSYFFFNRREFDGFLPFESGGVIELSRNYFGHGTSSELSFDKHKFKVGYDLLLQYDDRQRFQNLEGVKGALDFDQEESFENLGLYALDRLTLGDFHIHGGLRFDVNEIEAKDQRLQDGDASGKISLNNFSTMLGFGYALSPKWFAFADYSSGFKTPTLNQLSNRPDGREGFNDLNPQLARNFEGGLRFRNGMVKTEVTAFFIETKDDLVSYELAAFPGRTLFRNIGRTQRKGLETSFQYQSENFLLSFAYTYSDFTFREYLNDGEDFSGNQFSGIPKHFSNLNLRQNINQWSVDLNLNYSGDLFADDANTTQVDDYILANLKLDYLIKTNALELKPFVGFNNLFNTKYFDNIRINAFGGRYYEPAPRFNFYAGVSLRLD